MQKKKKKIKIKLVGTPCTCVMSYGSKASTFSTSTTLLCVASIAPRSRCCVSCAVSFSMCCWLCVCTVSISGVAAQVMNRAQLTSSCAECSMTSC